MQIFGTPVSHRSSKIIIITPLIYIILIGILTYVNIIIKELSCSEISLKLPKPLAKYSYNGFAPTNATIGKIKLTPYSKILIR